MPSAPADSWTEVSPGRYQRSADSTEVLLKNCAGCFEHLGKEQWMLNVFVEAGFPGSSIDRVIAALRQAWIQTRYQHPFVAATLEDSTYTYETPARDGLAAWASTTFVVHRDTTPEELVRPSPRDLYSSLHYFPDESRLLLRVHHWLVDGIGAMHLLDELLSAYATAASPPTFGDEWRRLTPSLMAAADVSTTLSEKNRKVADDMFDGFVKSFPSVGLPVQHTEQGPGGTHHVALEFEPPVLERLLAGCRKKKLTITAAVQAAINLATNESRKQDKSARKYTAVAFFDYRKYMPAPYDDSRRWPMGNWMVGLPWSLPPTDFATQAAAVQEVYRTVIKKGDSTLMDSYGGFVSQMAALYSRPPPAGMPPPSQPQLSSIGNLDGRIGGRYEGENEVVVRRVEPTLDVLAAQPLVFQWSFLGTFYLNLCYNDSYFEDGYVREFLDRVRQILFEGIGIAG